MTPQSLPWATLFNRCRAVRERQPRDPYYGRCELKRGHYGQDHALERGMYIPRWSTEWTNTFQHHGGF